MTERPLVSVVIPVHNAELHLVQCLESVLAQSLKSIEVIAVDDASTDASSEILSRYAADPRVHIISFPQNRGVSAARNAGLAVAMGQFISFVDADDYIDNSMIHDLYLTSQELRVDIVGCGIKIVDLKGAVLGVRDFPLDSQIIYQPGEVREILHTAFAKKLLWYPVRSLYSRRLLVDHGVSFDEGIRKGEDSLFNLEALFSAQGIACISAAHYCYRQHLGSATAKSLVSESGNIEQLSNRVKSFYGNHQFDSRAYADFNDQLLRSDLPIAVVRLRGREDSFSQLRALLRSKPVVTALRCQSVMRLNAPLSVRVLLLLCKMAPPEVAAALLRLVK